MSAIVSTRPGSGRPSVKRALTIEFLLLASLSALGVLVIGITVLTATESWRAYRTALTQTEFDAAANRYVQGLYEVLLERVDTGNALAADDPASPAVIATIEQHRKIVKENIQIALPAIESRDFPDKAGLVAAFKAASAKAEDYRRRADAAIALPLAQRDETLGRDFIPALSKSADAALDLWFGALYSAAKDDAVLRNLASIKEIGWRMRALGGRERSLVAASIVAGTPIPAATIADIGQLRARVDLLWEELANLTRAADTHPAIRKAIEAAHTLYFGQFRTYADEIRRIGDANEKYPINADQWVEQTTPKLASLLQVLDAASIASEEHARRIQIRSFRNLVISLGLLVLGVVLVGICMFIVIARVVRPLSTLTTVVRRLAANDTAVELGGIRHGDEIGVLAGALDVFKNALIESAGLRATQAEMAKREAAERRQLLHGLADQFEAAVSEVVETVSSSAKQLEGAAGTLSQTAETTQGLSAVVAGASEEASYNAQSVAVATEELSASVNEIGRQVQESMRISHDAVLQAEMTDARIYQLSQAAARIDGVLKLITTVAEQTNLLALNATIEAARAGESGRGFAVVAQEVKALAAQTAKATREIGDQILGMQTATHESVAAIKEIGTTINRMAEIASAIGAAVQEQSSATQEIARNVTEAARGTTHVAASIGDVSRGAAETGTASGQVLSSAKILSRDGERLKLEVDKFMVTVRSA
jgi:methyl-accepting chemotaxis protein